MIVNNPLHFATLLGALLVAGASAGCGKPSGPRRGFDAFYDAVKSNDITAFASLLSADTKKRITEIESSLGRAGDSPETGSAGDSPPPESYVEFALRRLNAAVPFDQIHADQHGSTAAFTFRAQGGKRGKVKLVREHDAWKLDLAESVAGWGRLRAWALDASKLISDRPGAPPNGSLGGIPILSDVEGALLLSHEVVPEVLWVDGAGEAGG